MKSSAYVSAISLVAALGGLLFGFDTAVISGAEKSIQQLFNLNGFWHGFTVAIAIIGAVIGSLIAGKPADRYGRKRILFVIALFYAVSAIGSAIAYNWYAFLFYRFLGGLGVGASSVVGPMYTSEVSPSHIRGKLVASFQLNIVFGILLSYFSNYLLSGIEHDAWRWMLGVEAIPAIAFFGLLFLIPNSPRWLVRENRLAAAEAVLTRIGETDVAAKIDEIVDSMKSEVDTARERLFSRKYSVPVMCAVMVAIFNQLSGINAIMYYVPRIFEMAGLAKESALLQSVTIGTTLFIFTVVGMTIIDKIGRKKLLLIGAMGMVFFQGMVARAFYIGQQDGYSVVLYLIGFIAFFASSQGVVIWVFIAEILPNKVRAKGQALGSFTHWTMAALISWTFPIMINHPAIGGGHSFMFFSVMMVVMFLYVWKYIPETKGKSLEQIQKELGIN